MPAIGGRNKATRHGAESHAAASSTLQAQKQPTITSALAADPSLAPEVAAKRLFPLPRAYRRGLLRFRIKEQLEEGRGHTWNWHNGATHHGNEEPGEEELEGVRTRFGYKKEKDGGPSRLYLMILADALLPLPRNPMSGVVSPPLLATTGIVPCSIFSTGPDIIEHYCDCIVAAKREVVLLTNYWQGGKNVNRISESLKELSKRVQKRIDEGKTGTNQRLKTGTDTTQARALSKIVVKVMWDRGPQTLADLFRCRKPVPSGMWKSNGLPEPEEIPNLDLEILNYHRPLMGTFHAKLLLVDRQVALINSNNIQDRPNVEACTRLEGDIVNSIYDHALISWGNPLNPPLPCLSTPAPKEPSASAFVQGTEGSLPVMTEDRLRKLAEQARRRLHEEDEETEEEKHLLGGGGPNVHRRMSFADVVEGMMKHDLHKAGGAGGSASRPRSRRGSGDIQSGLFAKTPGQSGMTASGSGVSGEEGATSSPLKENSNEAARAAGITWASKVLGERWQSPSGHGDSDGTANATGTNTVQDGQQYGGAGKAGSSGAGGGDRRHFADYVEAMMKKEGMKHHLWAEGALDTLGLGPSSSRNVADEVRRSRERRQGTGAATTRGVSIPRAVSEEDKVERNEAGTNGSSGLAAPQRSQTAVESGNDEQTAVSSLGNSNAAQQDPGDTFRQQEELAAKIEGREAMSEKVIVQDSREGAPGSVGYHRQHRRTLSTLSKVSASQRLAQITKSLDFANLSQVKGEIKADELAKYSKTAAQAEARGEAPELVSKTSGGTVNGDAAAPVHDSQSGNANDVAPSATRTMSASSRSPEKQDGSPEFLPSRGDLAAFAEAASDVLDFRPYVFHAPHQPVPMALMNRRPHGTPGHSDIRNPQDAAWLAGFRYAKEHIFIQSPTLNASPIKAAVLAAVRRHVRVELWLDLGFNDKSESMPFQGGTNEQVVTRLYRSLRREGKGDEKYLEVYWYTGKDMTRPLNAVRKQRNCHVKYAAFDGQVAILGSGNQDTQSWFHSQEINVCVDSKQIVREWDLALRRNQSTGQYGRVDSDGIWRGNSGSEVADTGKDPKQGAGKAGGQQQQQTGPGATTTSSSGSQSRSRSRSQSSSGASAGAGAALATASNKPSVPPTMDEKAVDSTTAAEAGKLKDEKKRKAEAPASQEKSPIAGADAGAGAGAGITIDGAPAAAPRGPAVTEQGQAKEQTELNEKS